MAPCRWVPQRKKGVREKPTYVSPRSGRGYNQCQLSSTHPMSLQIFVALLLRILLGCAAEAEVTRDDDNQVSGVVVAWSPFSVRFRK